MVKYTQFSVVSFCRADGCVILNVEVVGRRVLQGFGRKYC